MYYEFNVGVRVDGGRDLYAIIATPQSYNPSHLVADLLRECTGWNFDVNHWYCVDEILPLIEHGIDELSRNCSKYKQDKSKGPYDCLNVALDMLSLLRDCIYENAGMGSWFNRNEIPCNLLYVRYRAMGEAAFRKVLEE